MTDKQKEEEEEEEGENVESITYGFAVGKKGGRKDHEPAINLRSTPSLFSPTKFTRIVWSQLLPCST